MIEEFQDISTFKNAIMTGVDFVMAQQDYINTKEEITDVVESSNPSSISNPRISSDTKKCPFCAEEIKKEARKCKHCKSDISDDQSNSQTNIDVCILNIKWPGAWMLVNANVTVSFDDELLGEGSFNKGFNYTVKSFPGIHHITLKRKLVPKETFKISIPDKGTYITELSFNRIIGRFKIAS